MDKHYVVFFVVIGILTTLTLMFGILLFYEEFRYDLIHKTASKTPEVIMFHEKYGESIKRPLNSGTGIAYKVTDNKNSIELQYHVDHRSIPSIYATCIPEPNLNIQSYVIRHNMTDYLKNYNCFTDKYQ